MCYHWLRKAFFFFFNNNIVFNIYFFQFYFLVMATGHNVSLFRHSWIQFFFQYDFHIQILSNARRRLISWKNGWFCYYVYFWCHFYDCILFTKVKKQKHPHPLLKKRFEKRPIALEIILNTKNVKHIEFYSSPIFQLFSYKGFRENLEKPKFPPPLLFFFYFLNQKSCAK